MNFACPKFETWRVRVRENLVRIYLKWFGAVEESTSDFVPIRTNVEQFNVNTDLNKRKKLSDNSCLIDFLKNNAIRLHLENRISFEENLCFIVKNILSSHSSQKEKNASDVDDEVLSSCCFKWRCFGKYFRFIWWNCLDMIFFTITQ
ncbi:CLUMA_CG008077, isoform A [Clunio marinus]|uniref:CLUMA_CG008077, isoform A n=1 Tax=Clunio marinus TaxID=568069 RepID=A0A1J1I850_9DIPT|nr:CLUMA_CG008077, isoform A [Clunio marinus]